MRDYKVETIASLSRGLEVLRTLQELQAASLHDLHRVTGYSKTTLTRILKTCHEHGMVWQRLADGAFLPSYSSLQRHDPDDAGWLVEVASPVLEQLVERSMWPSVLSVPRLDYMETLETNSRKAYFDDVRRRPVGYRVNMLRSASGRAYLAACPAPEREAILARLRQRDVPGHGRAHDEAWLAEMLAATRARGFALRDPDFGGDYGRTREQVDDQRESMALPIHGRDRVVGCLNLTWRRKVLDVDQMVAAHLGDLRAAVARIERRIRAHDAATASWTLAEDATDA